MHFSPIGNLVLNEIQMAIKHKKNVLIPDFRIMPNHVHIIVGLQNDGISDKPELLDKPVQIAGEIHPLQKDSLPAFVNSFKGRVTRAARDLGYDNFAWQAKFHDRIIRDRLE